jgi:hypothetical protein
MFKNYFLSISLFFVSFGAIAQSSIEVKDLGAGAAIVSNGANIVDYTISKLVTSRLFEIKNTSSSTKTLTVARYDEILNTITPTDKAHAYFCLGTNCFTPTTFTASVVLLANQTTTLTTDLEEASSMGLSHVRYKTYVMGNSSDSLSLTLRYNGVVSVKNQGNLIQTISDVYPNPSSSKAFVTINVGFPLDVKVTIINSLGAVISTKTTELQSGKNTLSLDCESLPTGLYFVSINHGSQVITKKITVSK